MKASRQRIESWMRLALVAALAGAASGCMSLDPFNQEIDPNSPAAQRVAALARADDSYPRWENFPAAPQNVPTAMEIRNRVLGLEADEALLNRQVTAIDWTLTQDDGDPWAIRTRNRINRSLSQPVDPNAVAEAVAWARRMRERSAPPPPINY